MNELGNARTHGQTNETRPDPYAGDDVAAVLVEQLRSDEVTPGQRATIREELGIATPESMQVRLDYLQSRVSELDAYTDALETFIDDEGGVERALEAVRDDLARTNERLDDLEARFDAAADERAALAARLDDVCAALDALDGDEMDTDRTDGDGASETENREAPAFVAESIQEAEREYEKAE
jgi:outer membrane murein-binding lipoprotein Lpp